MEKPVILLLLFLTCCCADNNNNGNANQQWNPFQNPFSFQNTPSGFGQFPSFGGSNNGNSGFGSFGSGFGSGFGGNTNNNNNNNNPGSSRNANPTPNSGGFGGGNTGNWGGFQDFSPVFDNFRKQFSNQFPGFGFGGNSPNFTPTNSSTSDTGNQPATSDGVPDRTRPTAVTVSPSQPINNVRNTPRPAVVNQPPPVVVVSPTVPPVSSAPAQTGNSFTVVNRNCTQEGQVVGISPNANDECGTIECQCFKGTFFCYSTCSPPPAGQTCTPNMVDGTCPKYDNCGPIANSSTGNAEIFRCTGNSVHPAVCWLYEILFGKLTEPLGFFESVQTGCPLATQCICGSNGFVQPAQLRQEDFKTPANNLVYTRATPGNKGTFANS